ncbi:MAG: septum formation family protein [Acidimicrobiia bacterium]
MSNPMRLVRIAMLLTLVAAACGDDSASRDEFGRVDRPQELAVPELQTGDCFKDPEADQLGAMEVVEVVPCEHPHDTEIFYSFTLTAGEMPDVDTMRELAAGQCFPAFDAFVGIQFELSALDVFPLTPTPQQWDDGHRTVHCVLFNYDLSELVGSARGTAR